MEINDYDPTEKELENPPENSFEADQHFYTPSERYRKTLELIDKDLVLANLDDNSQIELRIIARIVLNAIKLEEMKKWDSSISDYWLKRFALKVTMTRAKGGHTADLSKTHISKGYSKSEAKLIENEKSLTKRVFGGNGN